MIARFTPACRLAFVSFVLTAMGVRGLAQLAANSPFLPAQPSGGAPTANAPLEYRGFMEIPDQGIKYRIYDPARKTSAWVKVNEKNADFPGVLVKQYDNDRKTLVVENDGRTLNLVERESKVVSSGAPQVVMPPPAGPPMPNAVTQTVALNPTPAQEAQRLEAVAAEVARRRALREQAAQQNNPDFIQKVQPPPPATQSQPAAVPQGQYNQPDAGRRGQNVTRPQPR